MIDLPAIDILIDPDDAAIERAKFVNARLLESMPAGWKLHATHVPHITTPQPSTGGDATWRRAWLVCQVSVITVPVLEDVNGWRAVGARWVSPESGYSKSGKRAPRVVS